MPQHTIKTSCPTCNEEDTWQTTNDFRPFCSHRCKLIDLGEWADGQHAIPGDAVDPRINEGEED
jgi:endogenous inhibitor of DNA gyrase (YacG/DUF329 family)